MMLLAGLWLPALCYICNIYSSVLVVQQKGRLIVQALTAEAVKELVCVLSSEEVSL